MRVVQTWLARVKRGEKGNRGAPVGAMVGLYYDDPAQPLEEGHVLQTSTGRAYRVVAVQPARVRYVDRSRWHLRALVIDPETIQPDDVIHRLHWYLRTRHSVRRERPVH
jgi:hypothetical protein